MYNLNYKESDRTKFLEVAQTFLKENLLQVVIKCKVFTYLPRWLNNFGGGKFEMSKYFTQGVIHKLRRRAGGGVQKTNYL